MAGFDGLSRVAERMGAAVLVGIAALAISSARADWADGGTAAAADGGTAAVAPAAILASAPVAGAGLNSCLSCHQPLLDGRKAHLTPKGGSCLACHQPAKSGATGACKSPAASAWELTAAEPLLCARCHDTTHAADAKPIANPKPGRPSALIVWGAGAWHPVINTKGCTACHDPHASKNPFLTKTWPADALCAKCHTRYDDAKFIHTAVKIGACLKCHSPHGSDVKPLLLTKREELCSSCHKPDDFMPGAVKHPPAAQGMCLTCHDPHESDEKALLVDPEAKLCASCHAEQAKPAHAIAMEKQRGFDRRPGEDAASCTSCHDPHSSDHAHLLYKTADGAP